jgi:hypothetical protein
MTRYYKKEHSLDTKWKTSDSRKTLWCSKLKEDKTEFVHFACQHRRHGNTTNIFLIFWLGSYSSTMSQPHRRNLAGFCLLICLTDSNELFLVVILVLSHLLVSLVPYWQVKVKVKVTLRLTVSQSVSMSWCRAQIWEIWPDIFFFFFESYGFVFYWGALSDERSGLSRVSACLWSP